MGPYIHHIDFIVSDLDRAIEVYETILETKVKKRVHFESRGVELAWFVVQEIRIILVCPTSGVGPVAEFARENGEGFFHIAYAVPDLSESIDRMERRGIRRSGGKRKGVEGWDLVDLNSADTFGALVQLVEDTESLRREE